MTRVFGVLGGIGSGKSRVAALLAGPGGTVIDADRLAHEALATPEVAGLVRERFGPEVLDPEGRPDRERLGRRIFGSESAEEDRRALEGWIHPRVRARILELLSAAREAGIPRVVLDVPLLLENDAQHGLARLCDALVFVDTDTDERDRRARRTRGWPPGELARREATQMPLDLKRRRADHIIPNDGTEDELTHAVSRLLERLEVR